MSVNRPKIEKTTKFNIFSSIWIVPFIALAIASWLAYQYFDNLGPEIDIVFPKNEGLVAGQSVLKYKNVPVGKVTKINIDEKSNDVVVKVRVNSKEFIPYVTEKARFWIVKPEVGFSGISGLDTLISGTYINVYSKSGGKSFKSKYVGYEQPYQDTSKGKFFHLRSEDGKNISIGMPVYFKNIKVGKIAYKYLSLDNKHIDIIIFINNEYADYIQESTQFWIKSMMSVDFTHGKLDVDIAPLNFLIRGGIVFSSSSIDKDKKLSNKHIFTLYKNKTLAQSHTVDFANKNGKQFMIHTKKSVSGLSNGSVVRFDGFDIGKVLKIKLLYDKVTHSMSGDVLISINLTIFKDMNNSGKENFYKAVEDGLRAKISGLSPIGNIQYIDLIFEHNDTNATIVKIGKYNYIPTVSKSSLGIVDSVKQILNKINNLPLNKLVASVKNLVDDSKKPVKDADTLLIALKHSVDNINKMTNRKSFKVVPDELNKALREMTRTLRTTKKVVKGYDSNSLIKEQLSQTLRVLTKTSKEMERFLRMLNRKPNSLIFGDN